MLSTCVNHQTSSPSLGQVDAKGGLTGVGIHLCMLALIWNADWGERDCLHACHILHLHIDADETLFANRNHAY